MEWKDKIDSFRKIDVRGISGNFFQGLKKQAMQLPAGNGLEIVQSFDPIPLYEVMEGLGYEHFTKQKGVAEFHAYFYRTEVKQEEKDIPMRPAALTNMPLIDEKLGNIAVNFWDLTWNDEHRHLPYEIRLLLSLTNAVGAGTASSFPHQCSRRRKDAPGDKGTCEGIYLRPGQRGIG